VLEPSLLPNTLQHLNVRSLDTDVQRHRSGVYKVEDASVTQYRLLSQKELDLYYPTRTSEQLLFYLNPVQISLPGY
jgi:hypothetical protein